MNAERELVDICLLTTEIEDTNLWVGNTTVETRLRIRLQDKHLISIVSLYFLTFCNREFGLHSIYSKLLIESGERSSLVENPSDLPRTLLHHFWCKMRFTHLVLAVTVTSRWAAGHLE